MTRFRPIDRIPTHPGEVLLEDFLQPLELTQVELADYLGIPIQRVNEIVKGKRGVSADTAWLFSMAFGTTPELWLNLQANHDLARTKPKNRIKPIR
jgi:addiction module HigA family antidote